VSEKCKKKFNTSVSKILCPAPPTLNNHHMAYSMCFGLAMTFRISEWKQKPDSRPIVCS